MRVLSMMVKRSRDDDSVKVGVTYDEDYTMSPDQLPKLAVIPSGGGDRREYGTFELVRRGPTSAEFAPENDTELVEGDLLTASLLGVDVTVLVTDPASFSAQFSQD